MTHENKLREALQEFCDAMSACLGYPETSEELERLSNARDKAEKALAAEPAQQGKGEK